MSDLYNNCSKEILDLIKKMTIAFPISRDEAIHIITDIQFYTENGKLDKLIKYLEDVK